MTTTQAPARKVDKPEAVADTPVEPPAIKSRDMRLNAVGTLWREWHVRAPQEMIADDLRSPKIWRTLQGLPGTALIKGDHLWIFAFDDSWGVEAIVKFANAKEAKLAILKIFGFAADAGDRLFEDENFAVVFDGAGYGVKRKSDGTLVAASLGSEGLAVQALKSQYPHRVA